MNDSTTASCAMAARDTQSRSDSLRLMAASPYRFSGASATASHRASTTSSSRTGPMPGRRVDRRRTDGPAIGRDQTVDVRSGLAIDISGLTVSSARSSDAPPSARSAAPPRGRRRRERGLDDNALRADGQRRRASSASSRAFGRRRRRHRGQRPGASVIAFTITAGTASRRRRSRASSRSVSSRGTAAARVTTMKRVSRGFRISSCSARIDFEDRPAPRRAALAARAIDTSAAPAAAPAPSRARRPASRAASARDRSAPCP